jgi:hypothetical protein
VIFGKTFERLTSSNHEPIFVIQISGRFTV